MSRDIASKLGIHKATVSRTLNDPRGQALIEEGRRLAEEELKSLLPKAVRVVSECMDSEDERVRLLAVDRFTKLVGRGGEGDGGPSINVNVNTVYEARAKLIEAVREKAPPELIEGD